MRTHNTRVLAAALTAIALSACAVVPEPQAPLPPPVVVEVPVAPTCYEVTSLQRIEIPAETRIITGVSVIEVPGGRSIEQPTTQEIVTKQAEVYYALIDPATGNQREVNNFCDPSVVVGPVGPAPGQSVGG